MQQFRSLPWHAPYPHAVGTGYASTAVAFFVGLLAVALLMRAFSMGFFQTGFLLTQALLCARTPRGHAEEVALLVQREAE